jgi:hypothetical protein
VLEQFLRRLFGPEQRAGEDQVQHHFLLQKPGRQGPGLGKTHFAERPVGILGNTLFPERQGVGVADEVQVHDCLLVFWSGFPA